MHKALAIIIVVSGCSSVAVESPVITVQTELTSYQRGDSLTVRLSNLTDRSLSFSGCSIGAERFQNDGWRLASNGPLCALGLSTLPPAGEFVGKVFLSDSLTPGVYRVYFATVFDENNPLAAELRTSNPFRVD